MRNSLTISSVEGVKGRIDILGHLVGITEIGEEYPLTCIITHFGQFHADEVSAAALLRSFYVKNDLLVVRVPHQQDISEVEEMLKPYCSEVFTLDVGRVYDPTGLKFDHHQFSKDECQLSSAGMIYKWLKENNRISSRVAVELDNVVRAIDENDIGVRPFKPGELAWVVSNLNSENVYDIAAQNNQFSKAVGLTSEVFDSIKAKAEAMDKAIEELKSSKIYKLDNEDKFAIAEIDPEAENANRIWYNVIHELPEMGNVDLVIRFNKQTNEWNAQTVSLPNDQFAKKGRRIRVVDPLPEGIKFVHKGEFFMVAESKEALIDYLKSNLVF